MLKKITKTTENILNLFPFFLGNISSWLILLMIFLSSMIVILRYVFEIGVVAMQELLVYSHGMLFLFYAALALKDDAHVRVDIFYRELSDKRKRMINIFGNLFFLQPFAWVILIFSFVLNRYFLKPIKNLVSYTKTIKNKNPKTTNIDTLKLRNDELGLLSNSLDDMTLELQKRISHAENFSTDLVHEIRNPLASLKSASEILHDAQDSEQRLKLINILSHDVQRIERLITDYSQILKDEVALIKEKLNKEILAIHIDHNQNKNSKNWIEHCKKFCETIQVPFACSQIKSNKKALSENIFSKLEIPQTIAAGPGPGNTDERVLAAFSNAGLADHMHADVLRGMIECKKMLRDVWGTGNIHTFGVAGTGWSGLDMMFSGVQPGDKVVMFVNGTFATIIGKY